MTRNDLVEIVIHGRGGQGSVTAANLLVAAALLDGNKGLQAFPVFSAERRGAPVRAFARISETEIHLRSEIYTPDIVIVLDESIMDIVDVLKGLKKDGKILINTRKKQKNGINSHNRNPHNYNDHRNCFSYSRINNISLQNLNISN